MRTVEIFSPIRRELLGIARGALEMRMEQQEERRRSSMRKAVVMDPSDNVATALKDLKKAEVIATEIGDKAVNIKLLQDLQFGHKFALRDIGASEHVRKYGEVIGAATEPIKQGEHVHVHNVEGLRGRGDKKK